MTLLEHRVSVSDVGSGRPWLSTLPSFTYNGTAADFLRVFQYLCLSAQAVPFHLANFPELNHKDMDEKKTNPQIEVVDIDSLIPDDRNFSRI